LVPAHLGVAYSTLWQAERDYARLKPEQEATLTQFYWQQVHEHLARISQAVTTTK
jgi:hypothetical protein